MPVGVGKSAMPEPTGRRLEICVTLSIMSLTLFTSASELDRSKCQGDVCLLPNPTQLVRLSHLALRWTILTMVRTQETRFAEWSEFEGLDTSEPLWRIPPERMKMRSEHVVRLPPQGVALLDEIRRSNRYLAAGNMKFGRFLFPVVSSKSSTISENRMLDIMYRIGLRGKATVHGFRGLASTVLKRKRALRAGLDRASACPYPARRACSLPLGALSLSPAQYDGVVG